MKERTKETIKQLTHLGGALLGAAGLALASSTLGAAGFGDFHPDHVVGGLLFVNSFVLFACCWRGIV